MSRMCFIDGLRWRCGFIHPLMRGGTVSKSTTQPELFDTESPATEHRGWAEWPESDLEIDDEAFAAAIAQGRKLADAA